MENAKFPLLCYNINLEVTKSKNRLWKNYKEKYPFEWYEGIGEMLCVIRRPILLSYYIVHTWSLIRNKAIILLIESM